MTWYRARGQAPSRRRPAGSMWLAGALATAMCLPTAQADDTEASGELATQLRSSDPGVVQAALEQLKAAPADTPEARSVVEERLGSGLPKAQTLAAFEALAAIGETGSSSAIAPYVGHRDPEIAAAAAQALAKTKGTDAERALRSALTRLDRRVRGYAAIGLGLIGAKPAFEDLQRALAKGVPEAAPALGRLCEGEGCPSLLDSIGNVPFEVVTSAVDPMLFRDPPLVEAHQLAIVTKIAAFKTNEAKRYLADVLARSSSSRPASVRKALEEAIDTLPGSAT